MKTLVVSKHPEGAIESNSCKLIEKQLNPIKVSFRKNSQALASKTYLNDKILHFSLAHFCCYFFKGHCRKFLGKPLFSFIRYGKIYLNAY